MVEVMNEKKLKLQQQLGEILAELEQLKNSDLPVEILAERLKQLHARQAELQNQLIDEVVSDDDGYREEAWEGLLLGWLAFVKSVQLSVVPEEAKTKKHWFKRLAVKFRKQHSKRSWIGATLSKFVGAITHNSLVAWVCAFALIYLLLVAVGCLGSGFQAFFGGAEGAKQLFAFASNPFMGLVLGILATALIQSSSTTTSVVVALCAAGLPITTAIPMIFGANLGTSVTNTLVSLGHIGNKHEFRRAFAAATVHDFFNLFAILIFFPLELCTGFLEKLSGWLSGLFFGAGTGGFSLDNLNFIKPIIKPAEKTLQGMFQTIPGPEWLGDSLFIVFGLFLIFASILLLGKILRALLVGRAQKIFHAAVGKNSVVAIGSGFTVTAIVQSSSTTTSLMVPLAGSGVMSLKEVYPFTLGANIGTCVTGLIAALAITGTGSAAALQIAMIHFLFNFIGVCLIFGVPFLRRIPMICASLLARQAIRRRSIALAYVLGVFFIAPVACLFVCELLK